jgi:hypothetical protein
MVTGTALIEGVSSTVRRPDGGERRRWWRGSSGGRRQCPRGPAALGDDGKCGGVID